MEKAPELSTHVEKKNKVFKFFLSGDFNDCTACIKILNALDLDEHGIQFLCLKENGFCCGEISLAGLLEVKEGTIVDGMPRFFRTLDNLFWDCITTFSLCDDVDSWLVPCFEKKVRPTWLTLKKGGVVMKKGALTVPTPEKEGVVMKKKEPLGSMKQMNSGT